MTNAKLFALLLSLLLLLGLPLLGSPASAQGAWSYEATPTSPYSARPVEQYPPPSSAAQRASHRGYQGSFNLGVPIFLNADRNVVRPGVDLNGFGGFDMGYVVFGLGLGAMWTPINFYNIPGIDPGYDRRPMTRLYLAPEVRVQVPNNTRLLPYLGISFDANWWRVAESNVVCSGNFYYYCARVAVFRFTPGMTARVGLAIRVASGTYVDLGVKYSLTGPGSFFFQREQWVTPYVGMLFR